MINGKKLHDLRKEKNLTKEQLGTKLGVGPYKIEEWEAGEGEPDPDTLITLTTILDCSLSDIFDDHDDYRREKKRVSAYKSFPYPLLATAVYLVMGFWFHLWHPGWIIFLTIPLYYTMGVFFIPGKSKKEFCYPVLAIIVYLLLGFYGDYWHPGWLIFFTIPVYYWVVR